MSQSTQDKLRSALLESIREIERLRAELGAKQPSNDPVAIIGIGLRLPGGVCDLGSLWTLLENGTDTVRAIPRERWDADAVYDARPEATGKSYVRDASLLDRVDLFDAGFFNIAPREAKALDPQHRLLLEVGWEALEHAGIIPASLGNSDTGVYVGIGQGDYGFHPEVQADAHALAGLPSCFSAGRLAYTLGLQGPAVAIDTACSSSLVALHTAVTSLHAHQCSLALVGGVNVMTSAEPFIQLSRSRALAPDGRCKTFSDNADGYGRGEGAIVVVLERLSDAQKHRHRVLAVVRGSAVNHDGRSSSITAPNGSSQQKVLRAAIADAGIAARDVDFVECHGTGTSLGDPIEVLALSQVYGDQRDKTRPLKIGALKPNIGHLEAASGLAGIAKLLAALQHEQLPATIHSLPRNTHIDWHDLPIEVVDRATPWPSSGPRRAGVSSFGLSGTNAHVIIESPPAAMTTGASSAPELAPVPILVSGRSEAALAGNLARVRELVASSDTSLADLGRALACERTHFEHRVAILAGDRSQLLRSLEPGADAISGRARKSAKLAVAFTGQGSQWSGMALASYERLPGFKAAFDEVVRAFEPHLDFSLAEVVFRDPNREIHRTSRTQPALFALEVALYRLYGSWGLDPDYLIGHSIGELVAVHVGGALSLDAACKVVATRARLMESVATRGGMVAIQATEAEVRELLPQHPGVDVAAINGPNSTVIAGDADAVTRCAAALAERGHKTRALEVSHAFHSHHMDPILEQFRATIAGVEFQRLSTPVISNVTGGVLSDAELRSPDYWARHIRQSVRFLDGVRSLEKRGVDTFLEIGPHPALTPMLAATVTSPDAQFVETLRRDHGGPAKLLEALCKIHVRGFAIDWAPVFGESDAAKVPLPTYAFDRQRCWIDGSDRPQNSPSDGTYPLSGRRTDLPDGTSIHEIAVSPTIQNYIEHHVVYDRIVVPGAFHIGVLLAVAEARWPNRPVAIDDVEFLRAATFSAREDRAVLAVLLRPIADGEQHEATVFFKDDSQWTRVAIAKLAPAAEPSAVDSLDPRTLIWTEARAALDDSLRRFNIDWGPRWWWLRGVAEADGAVLGKFVAHEDITPNDAPLPAGLVDNAFALTSWSSLAALAQNPDATPRLPAFVGRVAWHGRHGVPAFGRVVGRPVDDRGFEANIVLFDEQGLELARITDFRSLPAPRDLFLHDFDDIYQLETTSVDLPATPPASGWFVWGEDSLELTSSLGDGVRRLGRLDELWSDAAEQTASVVLAVGSGTDPLERSAWALERLQSWLDEPRTKQARLIVVTKNALALAEERELDPASYAIWGLVRAAQGENPERRIWLVDIDDDARSRSALARIETTESDGQFVVREGQVSRLELRKHKGTEARALDLDPTGTVLITGGTGGLGGALAQHLVREHGVRNLLLLSRRGLDSAEANAIVAALEADGASVQVRQVDVSSRESLADAIAAIPAQNPLTAVFHLAAVLDDGVIQALTPARLGVVFKPKVLAAQHLHDLTRELPLAAFVVFSSLAGIVGSPGQGSYAAANAFVDALCVQRRKLGLPATSLAWGPWDEGGMAARMSATDKARLLRNGLRPLSRRRGFKLMDAALAADVANLTIAQFGATIDRPSVPGILRALLRPAARESSARELDFQSAIKQASPEARTEIVGALVRREVAAVLGSIDVPDDGDVSFHELGLDSLMTVELRNRLNQATGLRLQSTVIFDHGTLSALSGHLLAEVDSQLGAAEDAEVELEGDSITRMLRLAHAGQPRASLQQPTDKSRLLTMLRDAIVNEKHEVVGGFLQALTALRQTEPNTRPTPPQTTALSRSAVDADATPLYCIPSIAVPSTPLQYVRIAPELSRESFVWSARNPGYAPGERLADRREVFVDYHVSAIQSLAAGPRLVVLGYSAGGWLATDVAHRLEELEIPFAGLVLLDSPEPSVAVNISQLTFLHRTLDNYLSGHSVHTEEDLIYQMTSMLAAFAAYSSTNEIKSVRAPTLYLHAEGGLGVDMTGKVARTNPSASWKPSIPNMTIETVPFDHFQIIAEEARETARIVLDWLRRQKREA